MSAAVTLVVPLPKKPLTKFATAASSSSLWPRAKGGMKACSTGSGALEPASRIAIRLGAQWQRVSMSLWPDCVAKPGCFLQLSRFGCWSASYGGLDTHCWLPGYAAQVTAADGGGRQ